jgi:hypothetical protein
LGVLSFCTDCSDDTTLEAGGSVRRTFASAVVLREISEKICSERTIGSNSFYREETSRTLWAKVELNCSLMTANLSEIFREMIDSTGKDEGPMDDFEYDIVLAKYTAHLRGCNRRAPYFGFTGTVWITLKELDSM